MNLWHMAAYAILSFASLSIALLVGWWIFQGGDIGGLKFDRAYFVLLVVLGLSAALMLFGVLRSVAQVSGRHLGFVFEAGGSAALFIVVVAGGFFLTNPSDVFSSVVRLRYSGPPIYRQHFNSALASCSIRISLGLGTNTYAPTSQGEIHILNVPQRFRNNTVTLELISSELYIAESEDAIVEIHFPDDDYQALELRVLFRENPDQRNAREMARRALEEVIVKAQRTLMRQDRLLFPAIDAFLRSPSESNWNRVIREADRTNREIQEGIDIALDYDARWGGLLGVPQRVGTSLDNVTDQANRLELSGHAGPLVEQWNQRSEKVQNLPNRRVLEQVYDWRRRLKLGYQMVVDELQPLIQQLRNPEV